MALLRPRLALAVAAPRDSRHRTSRQGRVRTPDLVRGDLAAFWGTPSGCALSDVNACPALSFPVAVAVVPPLELLVLVAPDSSSYLVPDP